MGELSPVTLTRVNGIALVHSTQREPLYHHNFKVMLMVVGCEQQLHTQVMKIPIPRQNNHYEKPPPLLIECNIEKLGGPGGQS